MTKKILYISGTRADYGLMRSVLFRINRHPGMELHIAATGMHLMPEFGSTIDEIYRDGFTCHSVDATYMQDTKESMALFIGRFIQECVHLTEDLKPDFILLLGDRGEMLGGAVVGTYLGIPVLHLHGGEITGTVDEIARHAITKMSHIHLPATEESAQRIIKMGEEPDRVHVVGAPGLDQVLETEFLSPEEISKRYNLDLSRPVILVVLHPVTLDSGDPASQMRRTMEAIRELSEQSIVIYPNADAGGRAMIEEIKTFERCQNIQEFPSIEHRDFLSLLKISSVIIGNSSSGIIEAPSFGVPAINIGPRQKGRQRGANVIDCGYDKHEIISATRHALYDKEYRARVLRAKNPYGDGKTGERVIHILEQVRVTPDLIQKKMTY